MKRLLILTLLLASTTTMFAQTTKQAKPKKQHSTTAKVRYSCLMHPEVVAYKPGKCPKCGMELEASNHK